MGSKLLAEVLSDTFNQSHDPAISIGTLDDIGLLGVPVIDGGDQKITILVGVAGAVDEYETSGASKLELAHWEGVALGSVVDVPKVDVASGGRVGVGRVSPEGVRQCPALFVLSEVCRQIGSVFFRDLFAKKIAEEYLDWSHGCLSVSRKAKPQ